MSRGDAAARSALFLVIGLAVIATGRSLANGFAFDDIPIIRDNAQVHTLSAPWVYAAQSYWPPANLGEAYRPWSIWWFAIQWAVGGGAPWVFHLGNLLLTIAVSVVVWRLASRLISAEGGLVAGALFAVHPLHVEATGNVVGQSELWMALFVTAACLVFVEARLRGALGGRHRLALAVLFVLAAASKEQGIVLPALLIPIEWALSPGDTWRGRARRLLPTLALLGVVGIGFLAGRFAVLGDLGGGPPAAGLEGLGILGRARLMLPLAFDWARLLVWPEHLLAQYTPPAYGSPETGLAPAILGAAVLLAALALGWLARRRAPGVTAGLLWIAIGILPVANVLFPTGVLIAERTLLLPSVGIALVGGALFAAAAPQRLRLAAAAAVLLVSLGAARSLSRQGVWRDNATLFAQTLIDEPRSYRSWFVTGREFVGLGQIDEARQMFARAAELWDQDHRVFEEWGQALRVGGRCEEAIPVLRRGVALRGVQTLSRARLVECLMTVGRLDEAATVASEGIALGGTEFESMLARVRKARHPAP